MAQNTNVLRALMKQLHIAVPSLSTWDSYTNPVRKSLNQGIIFIDNGTVRCGIDNDIEKLAIELFGVSNLQWQKTLHTDMEKVMYGDMYELLLDQLIHYFSVYHIDENIFAIPVEKIWADINVKPSIDTFTIIRVVNIDTAKEMVKEYLSNIISPKAEDMADIKTLIQFVSINPNQVKSFEIKILIYDTLGIIPNDPVDFIRYAVYKSTGKPVIVKNKETFSAIKHSKINFSRWFIMSNIPLEKFAEVFYRYKMLFLAIKQADNKSSATINKIRRLAKHYHIPAEKNTIQNVSLLCKEGNYSIARKILKNCSMRQLVKIYNFAMADDFNNGEYYRIRNGKGYVKENPSNRNPYLKFIVSSILKDRLVDAFSGKVFYIPENLNYVVPTTEKQFFGVIPYGTFIETNNSGSSVAIYWENDTTRVDLDLHLSSLEGNLGWNTAYRGDGIAYSGDIISASNGAVEGYYFSNHPSIPWTLNITKFSGAAPKNTKFFITNASVPTVANVKDGIIPPIPFTMPEGNMSLGVYYQNKFYFSESDFGGGRIPDRELMKKVSYIALSKMSKMLSLENFIRLGGGIVIHQPEETAISLAPGDITKKTLMDLVDSIN